MTSPRSTAFKSNLVHREDDENEGGITTGAGDFYRFKVLLPNGAAVGLRLPVEPEVREKDVKEFIRLVQGEYLVSPASSSSSYSDAEQDEKPLLPHNLLPQEIVQSMVKLFIDIHKEVLESIKDQIHTAASLVCHLSQDFTSSGPQVSLMEDIVGVVALLGTVRTNEESRVLSSYLDKDHMLAVVCRSSDAASALEEYDEDGDIDLELGLHAEATVVDERLPYQFLVICLDDIRPYKGKVASDSQRKLLLPDPVLGNGKIPDGLVDYAVNMIKIDDHHLETRTAEGFGLRETLFYRLFGDLQLYKTRNHMRAAQLCIREGAVSLDGGIIRGNGMASLGCRTCEVRFQFTELRDGQPIPSKLIKAKAAIKGEETEREEVKAAIQKCTRRREEIRKRFQQSKESCNKLASIVPYSGLS